MALFQHVTMTLVILTFLLLIKVPASPWLPSSSHLALGELLHLVYVGLHPLPLQLQLPHALLQLHEDADVHRRLLHAHFLGRRRTESIAGARSTINRP